MSIAPLSRVSGPASPLIGDHPLMMDLRREIALAAPTDSPVLIEGATGVGKELVAGLLHQLSGRAGRFIAVNVATLDNGLAEAELFGAAKGSYTGSDRTRRGLIEHAAGGTLFLDEAGELSHTLQVKLLRALEGGVIRSLGGGPEHTVEFRLLVSTQRSAEELVSCGKWREDFFYRAAGVWLHVPPLGARRSDISLLATHFLARMGRPPLDAGAYQLLAAQPWPGNVRELQRVLQRAAHAAGQASIDCSHVERALLRRLPSADAPSFVSAASQSIADVRRDAEHRAFMQALASAPSLAAAARALGISERTLYRRLKHLEIPVPRYGSEL